jgi:NTP pyrophosphatase (non-canonical NTP hydrolase)
MQNPNYSLNEWYQIINSIYIEANFYRDPSSILTHLVEITGGLAAASIGKTKPDLTEEAFLAKALGWWLTLCGKVRIRSVEGMIWAKYPNVCPYCEKNPHVSRDCKRRKKSHRDINWESLRTTGVRNSSDQPRTISDWQRMFDNIYGRDESGDKQKIIARITEEIGELAESVRLLPVTHMYFMNEATDVFAWLMRLANQIEEERETDESQIGILLENSLWTQYPGACGYCKNRPCKCPPVPPDIQGRLIKALPDTAFSNTELSQLLSFKDALLLFEEGSRSLNVDGRKIAEHDVRQLVEKFAEISNGLDNQGIQMREVREIVTDIRSQKAIQQESLDELMQAMRSMTENLNADQKQSFKKILMRSLENTVPVLAQIMIKQITQI